MGFPDKSDGALIRNGSGMARKTDEKNKQRKGKGQAAVKHGLSRTNRKICE